MRTVTHSDLTGPRSDRVSNSRRRLRDGDRHRLVLCQPLLLVQQLVPAIQTLLRPDERRHGERHTANHDIPGSQREQRVNTRGSFMGVGGALAPLINYDRLELKVTF